ncbi:MAG: hypothetical protein DMG64_04525 [Acidobacteria bacterium]|nr:MAG: hypothetical protein DMG64_04525 [Acidobacteriota bacterium]
MVPVSLLSRLCHSLPPGELAIKPHAEFHSRAVRPVMRRSIDGVDSATRAGSTHNSRTTVGGNA